MFYCFSCKVYQCSCESNISDKSDVPDHITGLTSKQKFLLKSSWDKIRRKDDEFVETGVLILTSLFKRYPSDRKYFPSFKNTSMDDLIKSEHFRSHCKLVMISLSSIVDNLYNLNILTKILNGIGENHRRHKIGPASFWNFKEVLIFEIFSKTFSEEEVETWDKALDVIFSMIVGNLEPQPIFNITLD